MAWGTRLLIAFALISAVYSKEKTKKALIIAVDELKPEESDAIISDLTIKDQRTSTYRRGGRSRAAKILERAPIDKELDYILVRPEDLKAIKKLEDITIEKPKILRYPESASEENYDGSRYAPYSQTLEPYAAKDEYVGNPSAKPKSSVKYPSRPAPPLETYQGGDNSNEDPIHKNYPIYNSPYISPYKQPISYDAPKVLTISGVHGPSYGFSTPINSNTYKFSKPSSYSDLGNSYGSSKPSSYPVHSMHGAFMPDSHSNPSYFGGSKPSSHSGPYTNSGSSYGTSNPSTYSGATAYKSPSTYSGPSMYESSKPNTYSESSSYESPKPYSYSGPSSYENPKPESYSGPSTHESSKPSSYLGPSTYENLKPSSYSRPSSYENSKPNSHSGPSTYESSKPSSYLGPSTYENPKPSSYSRPSSYENPKPNSYSGPSTHKSSKPNNYLGPSTYENPKPSSYSGPSTYEASKPTSYMGLPNYESSKASTYPGSSSYGSSKPVDNSGHSTYGNPKPSSYSSSPSYGSSKPGIFSDSYKYGSSRPGIYSDTPSYSVPENSYSSNSFAPGSSYLSNKPSSYSDPPNNYESANPHYDSSHEKTEKPISSPHKEPYSSDNNSPKTVSHGSEYDGDRNYTPSKTYGQKYYGSPSLSITPVKHVSYDSLTLPHSSYDNDLSKSTYSDFSTPSSHETYYDSPRKEPYFSPYEKERKQPSFHSSKPSASPASFKPTSTYNSSPDTGSLYDPSSYEEVSKPYKYRYPSSKVTYDSTTYHDNSPPRSTLSELKKAVKSKYEESMYPKPNIKGDYHSGYEAPPSITEFEESTRSLKSNNYDHPSTFSTHTNLEYGARYPIAYGHTPSKSQFTTGDNKSSLNLHHYRTKPENNSTKSHSGYRDNDDFSTVPNFHSVKKNYSPVRPAPLHDQLEQPRYPPLPEHPKRSKEKKYYNSEESQSKESDENYNPYSSYAAGKNSNPGTYSDSNQYKPLHSRGKTGLHYPTTGRDRHYYSDHSSEEIDNEAHSKPYTDSSVELSYFPDNRSKNSHKPSKIKTYSSEGKHFPVSQPEYSRPIYRPSQRSPEKYLYSYKTEKKPTVNATSPIHYSSFLSFLPPKRVEGVVYRSRESYPTFRRYKGYLPYKPNFSKSHSVYEYKSVPSEIRERNVTRDSPAYNLSKKSAKSKTTTHSSGESSHAAIPGEPGRDYPILKEIPYNYFSCENKLPGYYADVENRCQVYYRCSEEGRLQSFLCPNGTIFNQSTFVCEWWHNVDCSKSEKYFAKNNPLYKRQSSPKTKGTTNGNYRHLNSEIEERRKFPLYATDDKVFPSGDTLRRKPRSKVSKYS